MKQNSRTARLLAVALTATSALALASCMKPAGDGIGFREARFNEMSAVRDWQSCRDEAMSLDRQAHDEASAARYLASASLLEKCESGVSGDAKVTSDERVRSYALAVQNYIKGGDVPKARATLEKLKAAFPGTDLYYANGASFIDTMEFLTGVRDRSAVGMLDITNVDDDFKSEMRRAQYWKRN
jgi:hypothetical protein